MCGRHRAAPAGAWAGRQLIPPSHARCAPGCAPAGHTLASEWGGRSGGIPTTEDASCARGAGAPGACHPAMPPQNSCSGLPRPLIYLPKARSADRRRAPTIIMHSRRMCSVAACALALALLAGSAHCRTLQQVNCGRVLQPCGWPSASRRGKEPGAGPTLRRPAEGRHAPAPV